MKWLFPRAVPEALIALLLVGGACSPTSPVKPGPPILTTLTIVSPNGTPHGTRVDVTKDTKNCPSTYAEGNACDPTAFAVCELDASVVCHCDGTDMCDPKKGTLTCTYDPLSFVVATFDRLLDTTPFEAMPMTTVASLVGTPSTTAVAATDYTSSGTSTGLVFTQWSAPAFTGGFFADITGPTIAMTASPALPTDDTVTFTLDKSTVLAKDKKTPFSGDNLLKDGILAFKTSAFSAKVTVPAPPPPMHMGGGMMMPMACPDAGTPPNMDASAPEGGADGGTPDAPPADAEAGADATAEAGSDAATDAGSDAAADAGAPGDAALDVKISTDAAAADTGAGSDAGSDAGTIKPPSTDVPANMNMGAIEIDFTNPVDMTVLDHIKITEDGQAFADFMLDMSVTFPTTTVKIVPKTTWAAGKTYTITVDADVLDVLGKKLGAGAPPPASFTMSAN